ncbi:hypothetical protein HNY73_016290 [Argiope bruennichi]|uniref:Uncharacterized protein n=1 Tax=Argiope bruennichi TaxID=94029 RepID=A0A8T0EIF7_ARGBR|nr:hypothetical protein HNY73_016290 [Argiope bruennichi]
MVFISKRTVSPQLHSTTPTTNNRSKLPLHTNNIGAFSSSTIKYFQEKDFLDSGFRLVTQILKRKLFQIK